MFSFVFLYGWGLEILKWSLCVCVLILSWFFFFFFFFFFLWVCHSRTDCFQCFSHMCLNWINHLFCSYCFRKYSNQNYSNLALIFAACWILGAILVATSSWLVLQFLIIFDCFFFNIDACGEVISFIYSWLIFFLKFERIKFIHLLHIS